MTLGEKVKQLRKGSGWTLEELSARTEISKSHLSAIEKDNRKPSFVYMVRIAAEFHVPIAYFIGPEHLLGGQQAEFSPPDGEVLSRFEQLYDADTKRFIASESSRPYVVFARQLAEDESLTDAARVLQLLAQFLTEQKPPYTASTP